MQPEENKKNLIKVGIVGGGRGGKKFVEILVRNTQAELLFVCDINQDAPAIVEARNAGIETLADLKIAVSRNPDFIIETTGSNDVLQKLKMFIKDTNIIIVDHTIAVFMDKIVSDGPTRVKSAAKENFGMIQGQILKSTQDISSIILSINTVTSNLKRIGLNTRIEASRMGAQAAAFAIVADEVQGSVSTVNKMSDEITEISNNLLKASDKICLSLETLQ